MSTLQFLASTQSSTTTVPVVSTSDVLFVVAPAVLIAIVVVASAVRGDVSNRSRLIVVFGIVFLLAFFFNVQARAS
jgi:hypothetical protein